MSCPTVTGHQGMKPKTKTQKLAPSPTPDPTQVEILEVFAQAQRQPLRPYGGGGYKPSADEQEEWSVYRDRPELPER